MKHFIYITLIVIFTICGYYAGKHSWYTDINGKPYCYNTEEALNAERKYCNATIEALHYFYRKDTTNWNNVFKLTPEYKNIEIANNGDWEDFYSPNWK